MRRQEPGLRRTLVPGRGPLARVPPLLAFLVVIAVFTVAVLVGGLVGAALLAALAVFVGALIAVTWRQLRPGDRAMRVLVLLVLVALAVLQLR